MSRRVGLVVNPIAGMGGRVGLKGTDGPELLRRALARGAVPVAPARAARALARLAERAPEPLELIAARGPLGAEAARAAGLAVRELPGPPVRDGATTAADTRSTAAELAAERVDLIVFAGGDGTARDVNAAVAGRVPILGVPAGVKMHSGCFGATPEAAGEAAAAYLRAPGPHALVEAEIADAQDPAPGEEGAPRDAPPATVLHGVALVPREPTRILAAKQRSIPTDGALDAACARVAAEVDPAALTIFGPGTTTARIERALGQEPALLGVDAFHAGSMLARDAGEAELLALLDAHPAAHLVLGVVGGQGSLLGRGNQPLSPAVLRRIDRSRITVVADRRKLLALPAPRLRVDTGDPALDHDLSGHIRVRVAARETLLCELVS